MFTSAGQCPSCFKPYTVPLFWHGIQPPSPSPSCTCFANTTPILLSTSGTMEVLLQNPHTIEKSTILVKD